MEKISVAVRFRLSTSAAAAAADFQWRVDDNRITLHRVLGTPVSAASFAFDHVFDQSFTNASVYASLIKSLIQSAIDGFNGTAFAYGQTSSGKTFTMNGSEGDPGIIPLAVKDIFHCTQAIVDREFLIRVSYVEIYNEEINDLLSLESHRLPIHESLERGVYVAGLREEIVNTSEQVLELIKLGEENRHFGETNMNARSSRSHTIFRMVIESSLKDTTSSGNVSNVDAVRVSVLNLVDLAGSERIAKIGAGGVRLKEGKYINKSLMILGNVINKLSENGKQRGHIPYRDSKLTRILQPALGGNAKTSIICTLAPEEVHIEETKGTLLFASRAKRITNCAQVNEVLTDAALLKRQKLEIEELRIKLQGSHSEILEQVILKQRNDMHKSELELEKLMMELEEERKSRESLEHCVREQQKKIDILSSLESNQARNSSQSERAQAECEIKHLHSQRAVLECDMLKRESLIDRRHETKLTDFSKAKGVGGVPEQKLQDLIELRRYSRTTVCAGRFQFGGLIMVDSRSSQGNKKNDRYGKIHVITDIIEAACSGSTRIIDLCLQILRSIAGRLQRTGQDVTLQILVDSLKSNQKLRRLLPDLRRVAGPGEIPEGATLLLVNCSGEDNMAVCKVEIKDPISHSFSRLKACGSGYDNPVVKKMLDSLSYNASIDDVISKAIDAFEEAKRGERYTGGRLIIFTSDHGGPWTFYKDHKLTDYPDEDWDADEEWDT